VTEKPAGAALRHCPRFDFVCDVMRCTMMKSEDVCMFLNAIRDDVTFYDVALHNVAIRTWITPHEVAERTFMRALTTKKQQQNNHTKCSWLHCTTYRGHST
jgi:hypothetical protein